MRWELRCSVSYIYFETRAIICLTGLHSRKNKSGCTGGRILERRLNCWRGMVTVACYAGLPHLQNIKHNRISNLIMKSSNIFYENNNRRVLYYHTQRPRYKGYIKCFSNMAIERSLSSKVLYVQTSEPDSHPSLPNLIIRRNPLLLQRPPIHCRKPIPDSNTQGFRRR